MSKKAYVLLTALLLFLSLAQSVHAQGYDYVDNNTSNVDISPDVGSHSNFENQKDYDSIYDTLTEQNTGGEITKVGTDTSGTGNSLILSFSHTLVSGISRIIIVSIGIENGNTVDVSNVTYGGITMTLAVERITGTSGFRYLGEIWYLLENDLPSDGPHTVQITCSGTSSSLEVNGFCSEYTGVAQGAPETTDGASQLSGTTISNTISPSDGAWVISIAGSGNAGSFTHGQGQIEVLDFQDASSTFAVAELRGASVETSLSSTYSSTVNRLCRVAASWTALNFELDLEVQWTSATHDLPNEELCIFGGTMGSEDIRVDAWTGIAWQNLFTDLSSGWNNVSITDVLVGSTFTIRFSGGTETGDSSQDSWQIDATLLHVWGAPPIALFSFAPSSLYTGETITFNASESNDSDGTITTYFWAFGDGTNGTGEIITHVYADNGIYMTTLTVTDNDGLVDSTSANVTVLNRPPVVSFTESKETALTGEPIYFNASSTYDSDGSVVSYFWSFGDGSNATGMTAQHSYVDDGPYTVTLTVTDDDGAVSSATASKTILNRAPVAMFTESGTTVYPGENVQFNASASYDPDGSIASYFWTFGDGTNATGLVVSHAYADNGSYTVTLTVTDDDGSTSSETATKAVLNRSPIAVFTESTETAETGEAITFNASSSYDIDGIIVSYFWYFGDSSNATGVFATHVYGDNGVYNVTLTVTDDDGATDTVNSTKTVLNRSPVASFTESAETAYIGEPITFNASGSYDPDGAIASFYWDFGDLTNATGLIVGHEYSVNGTFTVVLTVTDNDGSSNSTSATKTILYNNPPVASFTESTATAYTTGPIAFNASSSYDSDGSIVSYFWDFGDGTNASGVTVSHAYAEDGVYTTTLTVTDNNGAAATATATKTILNRLPIASFTESATVVLTSEVVHFNASGSYDPDGTIVNYFWSLGDGTNATGITVNHSYIDNGTYTVTLTVTDNDGGTASVSATKAVVNRSPVASFTESATSVYTSEPITFDATASYDPDGSIFSYTWDFGDGNITTLTNPVVAHAYADNGTYTVTLTVTDDDGANANAIAVKTVLNSAPVAFFTESASVVLTGEVITFNASGSYDSDGSIVSYLWAFGDEANASGLVVNHVYSDDGTYTVTLTVTDDDGAIVSVTATKTAVNRSPVASFTESTETVYTSETITFDASASYDPDGTILSCFWSFGDGTNMTGVTVNHTYSDNGIYIVTLTVTDNDGATSSTAATKTVLNRAPIASFTESATTTFTGDAIFFNASASYDSDGIITSYIWAFGDGTNATGPTVSHAYADDGTYSVTLTVTDDDDATATATATKTILNRVPVAAFTESTETAYTGVVIAFNASVSFDPDGTIVSYYWNFGDGNMTTVTDTVITHAYAENGTYLVTLTVTDDDGATAESNATKTVLNRLPLALFTESAMIALTGEAIQFNASSSYDPDGIIVSYFWDFGDGTNSTGIAVQHYYSDQGTYVVTLSVIDNDDATASATATKTVLNRPPVASFTESAATVVRDEIIYFTASASYDPDGTIAGYYWDFGDGTNATGVAVAHAYADSGVYMVMLTITDDDGATTSTSATKTVEITPPVAIFDESSETVYTGEVITFNASSSYDPDGFIVGYFWDFGDGANASGLLVQHAYPDNGDYTVSLTVTDDDGASDTATSTKTVLNQPPVAIFTESTETASTLEPIYLNASQCYDLDGTIVSYFWDFGDETNATGVIVLHVYADNGVYVVTLTVTDDDGEIGSASSTKTVLNRPPTATFIESAETALTGETIAFDASSSFDPDGSITNYFWTFGDETNATGISVNHVYADDGTYTVTLTVTDDDGATDSVTSTKTLLNRPPIALFTESAETVYTNAIIQFNASSSYDPDGFITSYFWAFGDGINTTGVAVTHAYAQEGIYTVTLVVTDNDGGFTTVQATKTILGGVPDIKIVDVIPANTEIYKRRVLDISVVVTNEGEGGAEAFNVTLFFSEVHGWHLVEVDGHLVWSSGKGNSADFLLQTSTTIPASNPTLSFETKYDVESLYDFCFVQISTDEGATWVSLENAYTTHNHEDTEPDIIANLPGLSGASTNWPEWRTMSFDLSAYAGQAVMLGFRYMTDSAYAKEGWHVDNVALNGAVIPNQDFTQQIPPPLNRIQTLSVNDLGPNTQRTLVFSVNTTSIQAGKYSISALAGPVQAEIDTEDNFYGDGVVELMANPDVDGDGDVDIFDVVAIASLYGCKEGDARWNPAVDLVEDKVINIYDIVAVASHYGEQIP